MCCNISLSSILNLKDGQLVKKGDILNNRNIEQGLEQMLRIQSQDVQIKLVPGLNLGETDICIYVKRGNPIHSQKQGQE